MTTHIPLIRAGAFRPFPTWLIDAGIPIERAIAEAHLDGYPWDRADAPAPLTRMFDFVRDVASREGITDLGCRVFREDCIADLGTLGSIISTSATPREALVRAARAMPYFCSVERISVRDERGEPVLRLGFTARFDPVAIHIAQQYSASIIKAIVDAASATRQTLASVEIAPWPGVPPERLGEWLCPRIVASASGLLVMRFRPGALDKPYPRLARPAQIDDVLPASWLRLKDRASLVEATRIQIEEMLRDGAPSVHDVARATNVSTRTLQRKLAEAGASFRALLDDVRRVRALAEITGTNVPLGVISNELGYSRQASLSRSVRRWTERSGRRLRAEG